MDIVCPSGLKGIVRGMRGREAQAFVDPVLVRSHASMDTLLGNCWLETIDAGPYELVEPKGIGKTGAPQVPKLNWRDVLMGDRSHALLEIRAATFGQEYDFQVSCESCTQRYGWELELSALERKPLPEASFEKIRSKTNRFEIDISDGKVLAFKLPTGVEEIAVAKLKGGPQSTRRLGPVDAIWLQTLGIYVRAYDGAVPEGVNRHSDKLEGEDGVAMHPIPGGPTGIRRYLEDLDVTELQEVQEKIQSFDCGVETKIETICEHCGWQQWIELPFQRSFFARRAKKPAA